jgi:hypothetical protein
MSTSWALVTGASSGIGRALAVRLAQRGRPLVLVSRDGDALRTLAASLAVPTRVIVLDLAASASAGALDSGTADLDVDLVVLNAGFGTSGPFLSTDAAVERTMVELNCVAVLEACHRFGRRLAARRGGSLVLLGSVLGFQGVPGSATYAATKAFVQALAEGLRPELAAAGVAVLSVAPGPTHTGFASRAGMKLGLADTAEGVAARVERSIGRSGTVFPGFVAQLLRFGVLGLPRGLRSFIFGRAIAGMVGRA